MGKQTKYFRQSKKSLSGDRGAGNFAKINRNPWHAKIMSFLKVRGKGGVQQ